MQGQPTWILVLVAVLGGTGLLGGLASLVGSVLTHRLGVKGNEQAAREDELTAEDRLIGRLEDRLAAEVAEKHQAEQQRDTWRTRYELENEYVEKLRRHIWEGRGWPPPSRRSEEA